MSFSHLRAALSFKKLDNQTPVVPVSSNPQHKPPTARTDTANRTSATGRNPVQRIGNRRASIKFSPSTRRANRLPQLGVESTHGAHSTASNESGDPLNYFYSGFFCDDDEVERNGPSSFTVHSSRQTIISSRTSNRQKTSFFTRLASRVKPSNNVTTRGRLLKADNEHAHNSHLCFNHEEIPSPDLPSSEAMGSSQPSHPTSIIPDPARCSRFSMHGLGTLLLPQASQLGLKHRNRKTTLISPSKTTFDCHSRCTEESEWEDLGDTDKGLDESKTKARLAAWTTLTSGVAPQVVPDDVAARSMLKPDETRDRSQDFPAESAPLALCRTQSNSTASSGIDIDALPSVTSHLDTPFTPVVDQFSISVWEECQAGALRSSTDLVHGSLESSNALADLIEVLGLDNNGTEGHGLSSKAPDEGKSTSEVPLRPPRIDTLLDRQPLVTQPAELLLFPSLTTPTTPTTPKYATMSASHRSALDRSNSLTKPTLFSSRKGSNQSFHPILDNEVKKFSLPVPQALKSPSLHPHRSRDGPVPEPRGPRGNRKSFLPDISGRIIQTEARPKKLKRPSTAPQPSRPNIDQPPPTLDSPLPGKKGRCQTSNIFPRLLSRSAKPPPSS